MGSFSNQQPNIPKLFHEIMENDRRQEKERAKPVISFHKMADLLNDRKNLRRGAEKLLRWNTDKGNRQ